MDLSLDTVMVCDVSWRRSAAKHGLERVLSFHTCVPAESAPPHCRSGSPEPAEAGCKGAAWEERGSAKRSAALEVAVDGVEGEGVHV